MTPEEYAVLGDKVYDELRNHEWSASAALELTKTYFTSGAYKLELTKTYFTSDAYKYEPKNHEEE